MTDKHKTFSGVLNIGIKTKQNKNIGQDNKAHSPVVRIQFTRISGSEGVDTPTCIYWNTTFCQKTGRTNLFL